ncbi:MAG: hypothetical protein JNL49_13555 [Bacteroidia bacterium]|nr:hypothetical protein [Bacteroidia bacterium]
MKINSIIQSAKTMVLVLILGISCSIANAQTQRADSTRSTQDTSYRKSDYRKMDMDTMNRQNQMHKSDSLPLPKGTDQMQGDNNIEVESPGTATYNIVEENDQSISGVADWRTETNEEELKVYSGNSEGNNVIRTIEVVIPKQE